MVDIPVEGVVDIPVEGVVDIPVEGVVLQVQEPLEEVSLVLSLLNYFFPYMTN